jgi:AcrR family transcriptional regulator
MARLTRSQQQARTRGAVLGAAAAEFAEHGYAAAKIDRIADRGELTRGAVYSNFPSKRALYLAVLLDSLAANHAMADSVAAHDAMPDSVAAHHSVVAGTAAAAELVAVVDVAGGAEAFARVWLERLPFAGDPAEVGRLKARSLAGVFDDGPGRAAMAELARLESLLLALALESCRARGAGRRVRLAGLILTLLAGAAHLAESAPGFGDPFDVALACRHLAGLDVHDNGDPPHLPYVAAAQPCRDPWTPPAELTDALTGRPTRSDRDGIVVVLGSGRLDAAEETVRAAQPGDVVTVALVTDDPAETGALVRLRLTDLTACLRQVFGPAIRPTLRLVLDGGALAAAAGAGTADDTESAVRIRNGQIIGRANGRGAGYAAARAEAAAQPTGPRPPPAAQPPPSAQEAEAAAETAGIRAKADEG